MSIDAVPNYMADSFDERNSYCQEKKKQTVSYGVVVDGGGTTSSFTL